MGKREDDENKAEPKGLDDEIKEKLNRRVWGEGKEKRGYDFENGEFIGVCEPGNAYLRKEGDLDDLEGRVMRLIHGGREDICGEKEDICGRKEDMGGEKQEPCGDKTLEDYLALPEGARVELIDGVFYDMASPTSIHAKISMRIGMTLEKHVEDNRGRCQVFLAPLDVQLDCDDKTVVQPDVLVVCNKNQKIYPRIVGAPDFVVEVVSPSNFKMDVVKKRFKYEKAGVREYWMVFPEEKRIRVCHFEKGEEREYTFADKVPVGIWDGKCEIDFAVIYEWLKPLYEAMEEGNEN